MDWYESVFEVIDMRSFSNLWYWIVLAVLWSTVSHWVLGVPFDLISRARRDPEGEAMADLQALVGINVRRILYISDVSGSWVLLFGSAFFTALTLMALIYEIEFAQAVLFLLAPLSVLGGLTIRTSRLLHERGETGEDMILRLVRHRFATQMIGVVAIFITAMYGMFQNLYVGPLAY